MLRVYLRIKYYLKFEQANLNAICLSRPFFKQVAEI